ncbi:MAG: hypothetical protein H0W22_09000, partial [Chloroflexi bacterium]|nr:hypothetical protein [Chloroflexota bacterium]
MTQAATTTAVPDPALRYRRILLKLSGEALLGDRQYGVDPAFCAFIAKQVGEVHRLGVQVGIVVGGGNIFRGLAAAAKGMDRATGDYIGMLATVMNGLALQDALERAGVQIGIVVGGGNIFRGLAASARGMDRATGDYIGMLATVMNGLALQDAL